jgi:hypothetical protein
VIPDLPEIVQELAASPHDKIAAVLIGAFDSFEADTKHKSCVLKATPIFALAIFSGNCTEFSREVAHEMNLCHKSARAI